MKNTLQLLFLAFTAWSVQSQETPLVTGQCWRTVASGAFHNLAIGDDGKLWGWGKNYSSGLGNLPEDIPVPARIGTDSTWAAISCGNSHSLALKSDGTLWAWGRNDCGQVGIGFYTGYPVIEPTQIGTETDWAMVCAGGGLASAAIKTDGTLWAWGFVNTGESLEIEDQVSLFIVVPTQIGADTNWKSVDVGHNHTVAVKTDGTLWSWGLNAHGQLGLGNNINTYVPLQTGTDTDWDVAVASNVMTMALKADGTLWTWGENTGGSLGNGSTTGYQSNVPVQISTEHWRSIELGMNYFCGAIKDDGSLWTWGYNYDGAIGNGSFGYVGTPYRVPSDGEWSQYTGGGDYSVALKTDGSLWTWGGSNWDDQLGFNLEGDAILTPVQVVDACTTAGLKQLTAQKVTLYPNPATDVLTLNSIESISNITVTDVTGKTVITKNNTSQINVEQLPAGVYFLQVTLDKRIHRDKFIKL